jgi:hypothetical protein
LELAAMVPSILQLVQDHNHFQDRLQSLFLSLLPAAEAAKGQLCRPDYLEDLEVVGLRNRVEQEILHQHHHHKVILVLPVSFREQVAEVALVLLVLQELVVLAAQVVQD